MTDQTMRQIQLVGRIFLDFEIETVTGLHIGGSPGTLAIGNVDNPVIRNPFTGQPYVPGSSLRGKMRSQLEKKLGKRQNQSIGRDVNIHICKNAADYQNCEVCRTFGTPAENFTEATRLIVRDAALTEASEERLASMRTDLPYTEVKWEAAIDRVTSAATPRQQERVPAGAIFRGSLSFNLYNEADAHLFDHIIDALLLVEEDYLGGQGSRGSGQVKFNNLTLSIRGLEQYTRSTALAQDVKSLDELQARWETILAGLR